MMISDTVSLAFRNLRQSTLRTTLTALGVSIGIASLAGMVSLGVGLQEQAVGRFMRSGVFDSITVTPQFQFRGNPFGRGGLGARRGGLGQNGRGGSAVQAPEPAKSITDDTIKELLAIPDVKDAYPTIRVPVELRFDQYADYTTAVSVAMSQRGEGAFQTFAAGDFFRNDTDDACMLTSDFAKDISSLDPKELIGKTITLGYATSTPSSAPAPNAPVAGAGGSMSVGGMQIQRAERKFTIVGIVQREPTPGLGGFTGGSGLMLPLARARELSQVAVSVNAQSIVRGTAPAAGSKNYQSLTVKVNNAKVTEDVEKKIKDLGYGAFSIADALQAAKRAFIILDILLSLIGSIALAVSSLGIVNTMVMSILERTREIGIMKAVGGSDADVRGIFLVEASTIGALGGVVGIMLGWTVGKIINFGANWYIRSQGGEAAELFSLPWWLIAGSIGFAVIVSLIAGSYPARRAARLDPILALRHD